MAIKLTSTKQAAQLNGLKVLVYGASGAGKTRLCGTTGGNTVIISAESGLLSLRDSDIPVIEVQTLEDVFEAYQFVGQSQEASHFEWVCLDSISEIAEVVLAREKAVTVNGKKVDPRQAYGALSDQMGELLRAFRDLPGKNVYFSAKMEKQKDEQSGSMLYSPSMPGAKLGQAIPFMFDEVLVLRAEKDADGNLARFFQTAGDYNFTAKDRSGALDLYEPADLSAIRAKIVGTTQQ